MTGAAEHDLRKQRRVRKIDETTSQPHSLHSSSLTISGFLLVLRLRWPGKHLAIDFASGNRERAEARGAIVQHQVCGRDQKMQSDQPFWYSRKRTLADGVMVERAE